MKDPNSVLEKLKSGNQRFVKKLYDQCYANQNSRQPQLVEIQNPSAIVVGCSDARVPVETVFDQRNGELFVIRVAGNVITPTQLGSIEFAAQKFETRLILVLGHSQCGAVDATLELLSKPEVEISSNLQSIVEKIRPVARSVIDSNSGVSKDALLGKVIRANVLAAVDQIKQNSAILGDLIENDWLTVTAAEYDLTTGVVEFIK